MDSSLEPTALENADSQEPEYVSLLSRTRERSTELLAEHRALQVQLSRARLEPLFGHIRDLSITSIQGRLYTVADDVVFWEYTDATVNLLTPPSAKTKYTTFVVTSTQESPRAPVHLWCVPVKDLDDLAKIFFRTHFKDAILRADVVLALLVDSAPPQLINANVPLYTRGIA